MGLLDHSPLCNIRNVYDTSRQTHHTPCDLFIVWFQPDIHGVIRLIIQEQDNELIARSVVCVDVSIHIMDHYLLMPLTLVVAVAE
jgi:hypothetical protein